MGDMYSHKKHNCAHAAVNEHTFTNDIWSWRHWQRFVEERFEKDVFFCYTVAHDNIPFNWKAIYTSFAKILWFVVAIYFTLTFYFTDQGSSYVSLSKHPGCTEVPIPINNVYTLDLSGFWNGQQGHVESESFVRVRLSELTTTLEEFDTLMIGVAQIILAEAALSTSRDLAGNLASMMAWQRDFYRLNSEGVYTKHIIEFTADVSHVFDRFYKVGVLSNVDADCDVHMPVTYDRSTARMTATIAEAEFESSSKCQQAIEPAQLGYSGYASGPTISVGVDLHSLTIAYGISSGSVTMESFTLIVDPLFGDFDVYYGDDEYHLQIGIDEKFPGMDPVYCLLPDQRHNESSTYLFETLCVIKVFDQYVYPFFNHGGLAYHPSHGFDANTPLMCKCSDGTGFMEPCSDLDFFVGFLMFNKSSVSETFHEILNMVYANSPADINTFTYNASFAAHRLGGRASTHPPPGAEDGDPAALAQLSDPEWRRQTYAFCNNCSMFTLHVFDDLNYRVNAQGLQVFNGSCNDIITPQADWTNIEPPSKTIEDFFKCKPDEFDSLLNGLGIGVGDATIVVPTLIILSIPLLHLLAVFCLSEDRKREERHRFAALHEGVHVPGAGAVTGVDEPIQSPSRSPSGNSFVHSSRVEDLSEDHHHHHRHHHTGNHRAAAAAAAAAEAAAEEDLILGHDHHGNHMVGRHYHGHGDGAHHSAVRPVPLNLEASPTVSPDSLVSPGVVFSERHLFPVHLSKEEKEALKYAEELRHAEETVTSIIERQKEARLARNKTLVILSPVRKQKKKITNSPFMDTGPITHDDHRESELHPNSDSESECSSGSSAYSDVDSGEESNM